MPDFAYTAGQRVDMERHRAVREAMLWVQHGFPQQAAAILLDSVHKQHRWAEAALPKVRTCFECRHYEGIEITEWGDTSPVVNIGYCEEHREVIDSEIFAARDCQDYDS